MKTSADDRGILRGLASRVAEIAENPLNAERRRWWVEHNSLRSKSPMMLVFPEGAWCELIPDEMLQCADRGAREKEFALRARLYGWEHFQDDMVVEKDWVVTKRITNCGWGLREQWIQSPEARGARHFDPVIMDSTDLSKLRFPEIGHDEKASLLAFGEMHDLLAIF